MDNWSEREYFVTQENSILLLLPWRDEEKVLEEEKGLAFLSEFYGAICEEVKKKKNEVRKKWSEKESVKRM